jgi:hypothetical protein
MLLGVLIPGPGCGIEGEDIDFAEGASATGANTGEESGGTDTNGQTATAGDGDGDGDGTAGDGDGSPGDGDGSPGDGDGSPGDGDGSPGDGDGSPGDGDGDGDPNSCDQLMPSAVVDGPNAVMVAAGMSMFEGSCGAAGPESLYVYTASATGLVNFTLAVAEFDAAIYLVQGQCAPLVDIACAAAPDPLSLDLMMNQGDVVYVFVDSINGVGNASLEITVN